MNIIPVIAKADTLTPAECARFKKTVSGDKERERERESRLMIDSATSDSFDSLLSPEVCVLTNSCHEHELEWQSGEVVMEEENAREKEVREVVDGPACQ